MEMKIGLFDAGMTGLHKAGLAGLWMTLEALETEGVTSIAGGTWRRTPTEVTLIWEDKSFFPELLKESFKIDENGLLWFPALGRPIDNVEHAVVLQEALLGSFLQHNSSRKMDAAATPQGRITVYVDDYPFILQYRKFTQYNHQGTKKGTDFKPDGSTTLAGWLFPGGAVRHSGYGDKPTALEETAARALALRYAIIGVVYFQIKTQSLSKISPRCSVVIPEINDLHRYALARKRFVTYGASQLYASGTAEAGFRVLCELAGADLLNRIRTPSCRVISFTNLPWSPQQKSRVQLMDVRTGAAESLTIFTLCMHYLPPRFVPLEDNNFFWSLPQTPDLVARNLTQGRPWWAGFSDFLADAKRRKHILKYEKGGIGKMVENTDALPEGPERLFVAACHEAWWRRLGQIGEKARREGSSYNDQVAREFKRFRVRFSHCLNAVDLRKAVVDFWSRSGGPLKSLQTNWAEVLPMLDEQNWQAGRDLALLALVSYKPQTPEEQQALETAASQESEE